MEEFDNYSISDAWEDAAQWLQNFQAANPYDDRDISDIFLSADYCKESPYWPERVRNFSPPEPEKSE